MEENTTEQNIRYKTDDCSCNEHPFLKGLLTAMLIFLGSFCAFYVVTDWHMKSIFRPSFSREFNRYDKIAERNFYLENNSERDNNFIKSKIPGIVHIEQKKNAYKIFIDLRAFDNNENNLQITSRDNILNIHGRSIRKSKNNEQISEFQQNYLFGENVKLEDLTKETDGNYYIVTIPIKS